MSTRQTIEIALLAIVCIASLRTWFWKGPGFSPLKKLGLLLCLIVFVALALFILYH